MFKDHNKSIDNFRLLFVEIKKYIQLQKEFTRLEITEKMTILFSTLIAVTIMIILGMMALFYLLFALAYILEPIVGGLKISFCIIAGVYILLIIGVLLLKKQLIITPVANFLAKLFLNSKK